MRGLALGWLSLMLLVGLAGDASAGARRQRSTASRVQKMTPAEVAALQIKWREARTGDAFLTDTGLKAHDLAALRALHGGFKSKPKGRRPAYDPARIPEMKRAWKKVKSGEWKVHEFVDAYLPGRNYLEALRANYPGDFDPPARTTLYDPKQVPAMRRDWKRVRRGEWRVKEFVARYLDSYEGVLALRRAYPGDFEPTFSQKQSVPRKRRTVDDLPPEAVRQATVLFAAHQRDELRYSDLLARLSELGVRESDVRRLKQADPETFASREQFREANHDQMVDAVIELARSYRPGIRNLNDLFEVVNRSQEFVGRYGRVETDVGQNNWLLMRDRRHGDRLRRMLAAEIGLTHRPERARRQRPAGTRSQMSRSLQWRTGTAPDLGAMAGELAARLAREEPSPETFARVVAQLARKNPAFGSERRVRKMMYTFQRQYPELDRWKFEARRHSLRYVARWMECIHRAGPRASYQQVAELFRQSPEFAEDGRVPPTLKWGGDKAHLFPRGVQVRIRDRALYQSTRAWLEGMRTAPAGASMTAVSAGDPRRASYATAKKLTATLDDAEMRRLGFDPALLRQLRAAGWTGLGQASDPDFDYNLEPPELDMRLVRDILDMPRIPPLMRMFLDRLKGERPFSGSQTLFVGHRYSDVVPFMETMMAAGMQAKSAVFVTTPYPFNDATRVVLEHMGIDVVERKQSVAGVKAGIERGIRDLLARGDPRPILIFDDGGLATRVIQEKFADQMHRFKIVEITTAGHRLGMEFRDSFRRMPLVYGSAARNAVKVGITSTAHARRVVDRVIKLIAQSPIELPRRKVVVLGGGAMGAPATRALVKRAAELRRGGLEVVVVDPDPAVARRLRRVARVQPLETALRGAGMVLGMTGLELIGPEHLPLLEDGTILVQGSSKRNEFDMEGFERKGVKTLIPRTDGLPQKSYTYRFGRGPAAKRLHFLGDGWTINHDGSLHGTGMEELQLELAVLLETAKLVAKTSTQRTGQVIELGPDVQQEYVEAMPGRARRRAR